MLFRALLLFALLNCTLCAAEAQTQPMQTQFPNDPAGADKTVRNPNSPTIGSPEQEMLARQGLRAAEKDYQDNIERAREAAQLGTEIRDSFLRLNSLGRNEAKKLERLEKITRKIRSVAGGSETETSLENAPAQVEQALGQLAEVTVKLQKGVEKTPRQVISASVIENANEVLELLRLIHNLTQ